MRAGRGTDRLDQSPTQLLSCWCPSFAQFESKELHKLGASALGYIEYNQFRREFFLSPRATAPNERETQTNLARGNHAGSL